MKILQTVLAHPVNLLFLHITQPRHKLINCFFFRVSRVLMFFFRLKPMYIIKNAKTEATNGGVAGRVSVHPTRCFAVALRRASHSKAASVNGRESLWYSEKVSYRLTWRGMLWWGRRYTLYILPILLAIYLIRWSLCHSINTRKRV